MKQLFLSFILLFSNALYGMRLDEKTLSEETMKRLAAGCSTSHVLKWTNYVFATPTPAGIKHHCRIKADFYDYSCDNSQQNQVERSNLNCGVAAKMQRHLECWWLYKQALSAAINQK